jgi:sulfate permease, SulP family
MLPSALTIALLAAIQSLLSAVVADHMSGDRHKPDVELTAQGLANVLCPLFGGIPATGAIARTAANIRFGAKSPVAGMIHAATLLAILLLFAPAFRFVPLSALAAAMLVVAYNMGAWRSISPILHSTWADRLVWACTFALTVFADLTVAVEIGMILAAMLYIRQVTDTTSVEEVSPEYLRDGKAHILQDKPIPAHVTILRIHGPFLFGATRKLEEASRDIGHFNPVVILRLRNMTALDGTGVHAIEEFARRVVAVEKKLIICGARKQPAKLLRHSKLPGLIGAENLVPHVDAALVRANDFA